MALPTAAFSSINVIESWIDRPFTEFGDSETKVYYLRCICDANAYTSLTLGTSNLASAASAGVVSTRFTDSTARWVGDSQFSPSDGGNLMFLRKFANVPQTHSEYTSSVVSLPWEYKELPPSSPYPGSTTTYASIGGDHPLSTRLEFKYAISPAAIQIVPRFKIHAAGTSLAHEVKYVSTGNLPYIGDTIPSAQLFYSSIERATESTKISRWKGDIYVGVTPYIKPIDAI